MIAAIHNHAPWWGVYVWLAAMNALFVGLALVGRGDARRRG